MKIKLLFTLSLFASIIIGKAQTKEIIYLDENLIEISPSTFLKKINSATLYGRKYETENLTMHKVLYEYYFGKLDSTSNNQIHKLLASRNNKVDELDNLVIKYYDTLLDFTSLKLRNDEHQKSHKPEPIIINGDTVNTHKPYTKKKYYNEAKQHQKHLKKCAKKFTNKNTEVLYVYNIDKGYPIDYAAVEWIKDPFIFKNTFFKIIYENNLLILKPNGEYFLKNGHIPDKLITTLLKSNDWSKYKEDWLKSIKTNSTKGYGIIKKFNSFNNNIHPIHCY